MAMKTRTYSSYSSLSHRSDPRGSKTTRVAAAQRNGKGIARIQKEKNGTITKDDLVLSKEALFFFHDELEKQGFLSPKLTGKLLKSPRPAVRAVGRGSAAVQNLAADLTPVAADTLRSANVSPGYAAATLQAGVAKLGIKNALRRLGLGAKKSERVGNAMTFEGGVSPVATVNPLDFQGPIIGPIVNKIPDAIETAATFMAG